MEQQQCWQLETSWHFSPCDLSACVAQCGPGSGESFKSRSEKWLCLENFMPQTRSWTKSAHQCENQAAACQIHVPNSLADSYSLGPLEGQKWGKKKHHPRFPCLVSPKKSGEFRKHQLNHLGKFKIPQAFQHAELGHPVRHITLCLLDGSEEVHATERKGLDISDGRSASYHHL